MKVILFSVFLWVALGYSDAHGQTPDPASTAVEAAQPAALSWLALVDREQYAMSWDSAASVFRKAITRADWEAAARKARGPFGSFGARKLLGASYQTSFPSAPPGEYIVLQYRVGISNGKTVVETVTPMKDSAGQWRVSGYYVRPE